MSLERVDKAESHVIIHLVEKAAVEPVNKETGIAKKVAKVGMAILKGLSILSAVAIAAFFLHIPIVLVLIATAAIIVIGVIAFGVFMAIDAARAKKTIPQEKTIPVNLAEIELTPLLSPTPAPKRVGFDTASLGRVSSELKYARELTELHEELNDIDDILSTLKKAPLKEAPTTIYPLHEKLDELKRQLQAVENKISSQAIKERTKEQIAYIKSVSNVLIVLRQSLIVFDDPERASANVARTETTLQFYRNKTPKAPIWKELDALVDRMESRLNEVRVERMQGGS